MTIGERLVGDVAVLDVKGGMTRDKGYGSVKKRLDELLDRGRLSLLLNLSHVPYMDSASVGGTRQLLHHGSQSPRQAEDRRLPEPGHGAAGDFRTRYPGRGVRHGS